jgi:superfamily II DNA or RNA helicase
MPSLDLAPGAIVHVRQRRWVVEGVTPPPSAADSSLVQLACVDDDAQGQELTVLWGAEPDATILTDDGWARVGARGFDAPEVFAAYLNTQRWNSVTATDPTLFQSPFRAGIRIDAYQLEPLRKALALPRVNLFIADDVGLGKTIEAGLIARELLLRRRIETIVVAAPPSMLPQWQDELESRFGLTFVIVDRNYYAKCRRERGYGINPWTTHSRFLISTRLLIDETYVAGLRDWLGELRPQSLLILDEAHHAAPASGAKYAIDSRLTKYVRQEVAPRFEHRLFLSATPHNGHSHSFSALLEILDPNRFCRGVKVRPRDLDAVMVRRLKDDIREIEGGFPVREVPPVEIDGLPQDAPELLLAAKLDQYREMREARLAGEPPSVQRKARLVLITLQQRLLSSIEAFARTIGVHRKAMERASAGTHKTERQNARELAKALSPVEADEDRSEADPQSLAQQTELALTAATEGSFTKQDTERGIHDELRLLADLQDLADRYRDVDDARIKELLSWIDENLCPGAVKPTHASAPKWNRRRVIIFTEWEDTRHYIQRRLRAALSHTDRFEERIASFTGLTSQQKREELKHDFNSDPDTNPIRILIATDAAREGLNLQRHCYDLFHFDLPWNPSRLEQRNGRIDRKLQPQPVVYCRYFFYRQRPEDRVLRALVRKTETIRKELGALAQVIHRRTEAWLDGGIRRRNIDRQEQDIANTGDADSERTVKQELEEAEEQEIRSAKVRKQIDELRTYLARSRRRAGVERDHVRQAVDVGLQLSGGRALNLIRPEAKDQPALYGIDTEKTALAQDPTWVPAIDMLRERRQPDESLGAWRRNAAIRPLAFDDPGEIGDKAVQLHVEHRLVRRVLGRFVSKGLVDYDLSCACLAVGPDAIPRVVLIGRLSLFGPGGARLHEEMIEVTARWTDPADRKGPLQPYGREAEHRTLELLDAALAKPGRTVPEPVLRRLAGSVRRDVDDLTPHLARRAEAAREDAEAKLKERAHRESAAMIQLLADQAKRIGETERRWDQDQLVLNFNDLEMRQLERDRKYRRSRLAQIEIDQKREPQRILDSYTTRAARLEPVGIAYLWPATG